jgi:hypothetical protein
MDYEIKTKVCKSLSKQFGLEEIKIDEIILPNPPKQYGLHNADVIIPSYYEIHKNPSKILNIDYFEIIKDDIRNCRELNKYQLEYIKEIKDEYKYELISLFNQCIKAMNDIINEMT